MMMKSIIVVFVLAVAVSVEAFVPASVQKSSTSSTTSSTAQFALADRIFNLDLFAPKKDQNNYGARASKDMKVGKLTAKSYVPSGLTLAQYEKLRKDQQAKKDANYQMNVKKAGVFIDYTDFYTKRGTELDGDWKKSVTLGHRMAKTKFDWSGAEEAKVYDGSLKNGAGIFGKKPTAAGKATAAKPGAKAATPAPKKKMSFF